MKKEKKDVSSPSRKGAETINEQQFTEVNTPDVPNSHIHESRQQLLALTHQVKSLVEEGKFETINEAIVETCYRDETHHEFKKYGEWQKEGYQVHKGEKAFVLWGRPQTHEKEDPQQNKETKGQSADVLHEDSYQYYPVAYVFSDAQVSEINRNNRTELEALRNQELDEEMER